MVTNFFLIGIQAATKTKTNTLLSSETPGVRRTTNNNEGKTENIEKSNSLSADVPRWVKFIFINVIILFWWCRSYMLNLIVANTVKVACIIVKSLNFFSFYESVWNLLYYTKYRTAGDFGEHLLVTFITWEFLKLP